MDDLTDRARRFAQASYRYEGAEVSDCVHSLCDEIDALRAQVAALQAENTKLRGWLESEAQNGGRLQRKLNAAEAERDALRAKIPEGCTPADARMLRAANHALAAEVDALRAGLDAALDFAGTVAGGASWWDDVWAEHAGRIDAARAAKGAAR